MCITSHLFTGFDGGPDLHPNCFTTVTPAAVGEEHQGAAFMLSMSALYLHMHCWVLGSVVPGTFQGVQQVCSSIEFDHLVVNELRS